MFGIVQRRKYVFFMKQRVTGRIWGNLIGSVVFIILYMIIPESLRFTFGIIGGIGVGLSATYGWQAVFNSLGAMTIATEFLGVHGAIFYRIINNIFGAVLGYLFFYIFIRFFGYEYEYE